MPATMEERVEALRRQSSDRIVIPEDHFEAQKLQTSRRASSVEHGTKPRRKSSMAIKLSRQRSASAVVNATAAARIRSTVAWAMDGEQPSEGPPKLTFRSHVRDVVTSALFSNAILMVILFNTVLIVMQTDRVLMFEFGYYFDILDNVLLGIYIWELLIKVYALGMRAFCASGWNLFDAFIVITSLIEPIMTHGLRLFATTFDPEIFRLLRIFRAFRALRALRVLRSISFLKQLQVIVNTLIRSIPAMGSIGIILFLVLYIWAIIGVDLFGKKSSSTGAPALYPERFKTMPRAMFSLFQLITLDDWFEFYDDVAPRDEAAARYMLVYLMTFIILETFIFINLVIAVIVNNLERAQHAVSSHDKKSSGKAVAGVDDAEGKNGGPAFFGKLGPDGTAKQHERKINKERARLAEIANVSSNRSFNKARSGGAGSESPSFRRLRALQTGGSPASVLSEEEEDEANAKAMQDQRAALHAAFAGVHDIERYYGASSALTVLEKQRIADYFRIVASVEHNLYMYNMQPVALF